MNTTLFASAALALGISTAMANPTTTHGIPFAPVGKLSVSRSFVRTGMKPLLNWEITYPKKVTDIVEIGPNDEIIPKERTLMEVRVVGAAFQVGSNHTPLKLDAKIGSGTSWNTLFYGNDSAADASEVLLSQIVEPGTRIDFAAKAQKTNGRWYSSRNTLSNTQTVLALTNGDSVPNFIPAYDQGTVESFLHQYISTEDTVTIGPRDIIYLVELYSNDPSSSYFDMQDIVVVVSFKDVP